MSNAGKKVADLVKSREGKNQYTQGSKRNQVDSGYSDCSALTRWAYRNGAGVDIGSNTVGQINSKNLKTVDLKITAGIPDESKMQQGDLLFFRGADKGRKSSRYVGHVETYVGNGQLSGHGSGIGPTRKNMKDYCKKRQNTSSPVPSGNRGLICVRRLKEVESPEASGYKDAICVTQKGGTVNIRKAPNMSSSILGKVNTGQKFKAKPAVGSWCEVLVGSMKGYMHKDYIKF